MSIFDDVHWLHTTAPACEREAYIELITLANKWRKRNTAEKVAKALKAGPRRPFTST